jgi:PAS domain S-box-containing protein
MSTPVPLSSDRLPPSVWVELIGAYLRARFVITAVAAVASIVAGTINGWVRGPWVVLIVLAVMAHAYWLRTRSPDRATAVLVLDAVAFASVALIIGLLSMGLISLTFLMIGASVLERGGRVYVLWALDVILIGAALVANNYLPFAEYTVAQQRITEAVALLFTTWAVVSLTLALAVKLRAADTRRRIAEGELLAKKRRFRALLERSNDGLAITDVGLKIIEVGVQNHRIVGYEAEERVGRSILDLIVKEDRAKLVSAYRLVTEHPRSPAFFEVGVQRRDGEIRTMAGSVRNLMDDPDLHGLVFNFHDVTDERAFSAALEQANARLAELVKSKDEFIASVSHELRSPLTAVVGLAEILDQSEDISADERDEMHAMLANEARLTAAIVDDLLVAARADIGEVSVAAVRCSVGSIVRNAVGTSKGDMDVSVDIPSDLAALADPTRMLQVVRNLVTNAERHGGGCLLVSARVEGDLVVISVSDDGPGVSDGNAESIFEPYYRGENASTTPGSIGLGLHVSRVLARLMGGDIVYTRQGDLTVFEFSVPRVVDAAVDHRVGPQQPVAANPG